MKRTARLNPIGARGKRNQVADRAWRLAALQASDGRCRVCGRSDRRLEVHHIESRQARPDLRHDPSNAACLCTRCHQLVHEHPTWAKSVI
jgi:5-methylcytosine-specific restriction endonuclease McrA